MDWEIILWILALLLTAGLIFTSVFTLISYTDLECDYVNPVDLTRRVNTLIVPEMAGQALLITCLFLSGNWLEFVVNVPLLCWNVFKIVNRSYLLDPTQIFRTLAKQKRISFIKLGFFMVSFFLYLYRMVYYLVQTYVSSGGRLPNKEVLSRVF